MFQSAIHSNRKDKDETNGMDIDRWEWYHGLRDKTLTTVDVAVATSNVETQKPNQCRGRIEQFILIYSESESLWKLDNKCFRFWCWEYINTYNVCLRDYTFRFRFIFNFSLCLVIMNLFWKMKVFLAGLSRIYSRHSGSKC